MSFDCVTQPFQRWGKQVLGVLFIAMGSLVLTGCGGGGTVHDPFVPTKFISFGDGLSDITTGQRYTVNATDGQVMTIVEQVAVSYGFTTTAIVSTAKGNARIASTATFATSVPTLNNQVAGYLASNAVDSKDLFMLSGGLTDIIDEYQTYLTAGSTTVALNAMNANLDAAAANYVSIIQTLVNAKAKRIIVTPPYDLASTPWGLSQPDGGALLHTISRAFNDKLLTSMAPLDGRIVIYAPIEHTMNLIVNTSSNSLGLNALSTPICASPAADDAANGIGIGTVQLNASKCTDLTLISDTFTGTTATATLTAYAFADKIYPTPVVNRNLGASIYSTAASR